MSRDNGHKSGEAVFTAQQISTLTVQEIQRRRDMPHDGLLTGIPRVGDDLLPLRPGELVPVLGNTSNYKSGLMLFVARNIVNQIREDPEQVVLYCTWEQSVEEQGMIELAHASHIPADQLARGSLSEREWKSMMKAALDRAVTPLWHIGHSAQAKKRRPRLSMTDVAQALAFVVDKMGFNPALVVLDYLQRIRREQGSGTREQYMEIVDRAKDMALAFSCPVLLGTQASRGVLDRKWKLPQVSDSQETSNLEQSADKYLSVWMPKNTEPRGAIIGEGEGQFSVTDNLLMLSILKQKFGPAPRTYALHVEPELNEIHRIERVRLP